MRSAEDGRAGGEGSAETRRDHWGPGGRHHITYGGEGRTLIANLGTVMTRRLMMVMVSRSDHGMSLHQAQYRAGRPRLERDEGHQQRDRPTPLGPARAAERVPGILPH